MKRNCNFQRPSTLTMLLILIVFAVFAPSCKKSGGAGVSAQSLRQYFSKASQYTLFNKALQRAGLDTLLGGAIPYTVFAAVDSDMIKSGYTSAGLDTTNVQQLRNTLLYQMIQGSITASSLQLYQETPLTTQDSGYLAYLQNNNFGVFYNGIRVTGVDSGMSNGIIQRIEAMGAAPAGDLFATIAAIPSLSDYNYLIHYVNGYGSTAGDYLKNATPAAPLTVFLPNNTTFDNAGIGSYAALRGVVFNSVYWGNGEYFTCDFVGGSNLFLNGDQFGNKNYLWFTRDGYSFYPNTTTNTSPVGSNALFRIVQANIVATNGVIHIIQQ